MENLVDLNCYKNKKVFITGHTGFKGSWLNLWLEELGAEVAGYSLPPEKLSHFNVLNLKTKNYFNDINDFYSLKHALNQFKPDIVFHLAAQPLVRLSYDDPITTYETNVVGSLRVYLASLDANVKSLVSITTDKVYENNETNNPYKETDLLGGHDPYSSSKACMELMTNSFKKSYLKSNNMLIATARAGNVIGGGDWSTDRLIPDLVKNANENVTTNIRNQNSIRPWQHVLDPLHGYLILGKKLMDQDESYATSFNFGPQHADSKTVSDVASLTSQHWNKIKYQFIDSPEIKHEANLLRLNSEKANRELNWYPKWDTNNAISNTIAWYKKFYTEKLIISKEQLKNYSKL